jgi:hypothetical protein
MRISFFAVLGFAVLGLAVASCHDERPAIVADPNFANCAATKDQRENQCLIDAGTRADFDACIARTRKSCVDGGAP